jgi:protein involved in polysaccharide export with SLBB domain
MVRAQIQEAAQRDDPHCSPLTYGYESKQYLVLNFGNMKSWPSGSQSGDCSRGSVGGRYVFCARLVKMCLLFFSFLCCGGLIAQQIPGGQADGTQNPGTVDCSDPLQASSIQCTNPNGRSSAGYSFPSQPNTPNLGLSSEQPGAATRSYSDAESQARQQTAQGRTQQIPLRPEPLTEFQKFIATTTGQILPIFGANLFRSVPSTFAPLDMTPVPPDYVIGPGDELRLRIWGQVNFQANVQVDRAGEVYVPVSQVGPVHVAGLPYSQLTDRLRQAVGRVYKNFDLLVDLGRVRAIQVYVSGQARRPGVYTVSSLSTLIDALFASGGPSVQGSLRHIELRRGSDKVADFDLYAFLVHGDKSKDVKLLAGDVIFIPPTGPQAAVVGSVRNPAIYELTANESLSEAIADAGGVSAVASQARVSIERIEGHNERHAMEVAYDSTGLATALVEGDLIRVFSIVPKYTQTVTLRGNIANPGRFAWRPGMRVSDLIPDKDSLITRNYWWKRTQLGLPTPDFEPFMGFGNLKQPNDNQPISMPRSTPGTMESFNPYSQDQSRFQPQQDQIGQSQTDQFSQPQQNQSGGLNNQSQPMQQTLPINAQQRAASSSIAAQQSYSRTSGNVERTDVSIPAPEIDWDYADILRLDPSTLKTTLLAFDLGKLVLEHDTTQDLELQPGDVVTVFSEADIRLPIAEQTKVVRLEGEFLHAGLYTVKPGETLKQLVDRAGGLTSNAYLYGAEFTRESTRVMQQARMDEYIQSLDLRIQRSNLALSSSAITSAQELAGGASAQASERELLGRLRQIRASGRIVLEFKPSSSGTGQIPDLGLEAGDRFIVPSIPATVNVVGAVNDQNSFLYVQDRRVSTYLKKAGGLTKDADHRRAFVIRADGEVVGYGATRSAWGSNFENLRIYPGDTIVIPEKTLKPSALRGFLDWSQMFSQFALGAAAISVIQ